VPPWAPSRLERQLIWCYCYDGIYDLTGKNVGGPPPRPLTTLRVHVVPGSGGGPEQLVVEKV
jgi:Rieske Fe-S protein